MKQIYLFLHFCLKRSDQLTRKIQFFNENLNIINRVCATYLAGAADEEGVFVPGQRFDSKVSAN